MISSAYINLKKKKKINMSVSTKFDQKEKLSKKLVY